jgi:agmatine/peptidylarginine deiminase
MLALTGTGAGAMAMALRRLGQRRGVFPADFENHQGLLINWASDYTPPMQQALLEIMVAAVRNIELVLLVDDRRSRRDLEQRLQEAGIDAESVRFLEVRVGKSWARDVAPLIVKSFGNERVSGIVVDGEDQNLQAPVAKALGLPSLASSLRLDAGHLLSNGAGTCVTTTRVLQLNRWRGATKWQMAALLKKHLGATTTIFLEPLAGDPRGHVDQIAAFTAADEILVGECPSTEDGGNARILNENAERLRQHVTTRGPLRVSRVPLPPSRGEILRAFTTVVFANGIALLPMYRDVDAALNEQALSALQTSLPGWQVKQIETTPLTQGAGSLRRAVAPLYQLPATVGRQRRTPAASSSVGTGGPGRGGAS